MSDFKEFEDRFYCVSVHSRQTRSGIWMARGKFIRNDTNEPVWGAQTRSDNLEDALEQLENKLQTKVAALPRPPGDWGMTGMRQILARYRAFNDELTGHCIRLGNKQSEGVLSKDLLCDAHHQIRETVRKQTMELVRAIEALPDLERRHLLTSPEDIYQNILDPWSLDDVYAREAIFEYILHPSAELIALHDAHRARMIAEFEKESEPQKQTNKY